MPITITMPRLSDTMTEGTLIKWRVKVGDAVKSGDVLADIETDKATMELQSYDDGTVAALAVGEGQTAPVGQTILVLAEGGESVAAAAKAAGEGAAAGAIAQDAGGPATVAGEPQTVAVEASIAAESSAPGRLRISPLARKIAEQLHVDDAALRTIRGTGPDGRIIKRDILAVAGQTVQPPLGPGVPAPSAPARSDTPPSQGPPDLAGGELRTPPTTAPGLPSLSPGGKTIPLTSMRKTIARRLVESKTTIPHFTVTVAVDMDLLLGPHGAKKQLETQGIKLSVNDFVLRAAALSLLKHPEVNASWTADAIVLHPTVNLGIAVSLPPERGGGLVVPVLRNAQNLSLRAINAQSKALSDKARSQGLTAEEMAGGTFTISNLGMYGVDHFEAIINPPQAAILAVGAAVDKPVVRNGQVVAGKEMTCTLSADHRVVDGVLAAQFLQTLKHMLENPAVLLV